MPKLPPFNPSPVEVALCNHLQLPLNEVVADSFDVDELTGLVRWNQSVDDKIVQRTVRLDRHVLGHLLDKARRDSPAGGS